MLITPETLDIVFAGFKASFNEGLGQIENTRDRITTQIPSTAAEERYGWLKDVPNVREWLGDRVVNGFVLGDYAIKNRDFELTISVPANAIKDDQYGVMAPKMRVMGESVSAHREQLVWNTTVRSKSEQFQLVGYLRSKGFGFGHSKGLI